MGLLEPITHKEEIQRTIDSANQIYDKAKTKMDNQRKSTTASLEALGRAKIDAWAKGMEPFASSFGAFKNLEMKRISETNMNFIGCDEEPKQMLINIENASMNAIELAKAGVAAIGTGALVGVAAYGGAMMFGSASTGTAIAALSGAAKTNATLAWFGGGSKAAGGFGMAAGKLVLAGVVVAPIIAVAAVIANAKGRERLAEAKRVYAEAEYAATQMNIITEGMQGIAKMSKNYTAFIYKLNKTFKPFIAELERIRNNHTVDQDGFIDFDSLSPVEQKTLHLSWLMAQVYYRVLAIPILSPEGRVSNETEHVLDTAKADWKQIKNETYRMVGEDAPVGNLIWKPKANIMLILNLVAMSIIVIAGITFFSSNILKRILVLLCAAIACPVFFKFRNLPASRLYVWRMCRLGIAVCAMILIVVLV